jgi:hypothetical protein
MLQLVELYCLEAIFFFFFNFTLHLATRVFKAKASAQEREKKTFPRYVIPPIPTLLVGKNARAQAPSDNNNAKNNTSKKNSRTQSQKKFVTFNIKQQRIVFLELNCKEGEIM